MPGSDVAIEPIVGVGPPGRVVRLAGPGDRLAADPVIEHLDPAVGESGQEIRLHVDHVVPRLRDAVAEEDHPVAVPRQQGARVVPGLRPLGWGGTRRIAATPIARNVFMDHFPGSDAEGV